MWRIWMMSDFRAKAEFPEKVFEDPNVFEVSQRLSDIIDDVAAMSKLSASEM